MAWALAESLRMEHAKQEDLLAQPGATLDLKSNTIVAPDVGVLISLDELAEDWRQRGMQEVMLAKLRQLQGRYRSMRRVRGDGNCFYRSFLFRYLEHLVAKLDEANDAVAARIAAAPDDAAAAAVALDCPEWTAVKAKIRESKQRLLRVGYTEIAIDLFWEVFVKLLDELPTRSARALEELFRDETAESGYLIWYCRALAAAFIKEDPERFLPFILGSNHAEVNSFCTAEVEPMDRECEQVQIIALTEMLQIPVRIEYLDGRPLADGEHLTQLCFPEGVESQIVLLYRPGHYDILYPK